MSGIRTRGGRPTASCSTSAPRREAMQQVLEVEPEKAGDAGAWDNGNGSLMRILPVALRWGWGAAPVDEMLAMAHRVSSVTHRHPRSLMACGLYCLMARGLLRGMAPAEAYRYMIEEGERYYGRGPFSEVVHFAGSFGNCGGGGGRWVVGYAPYDGNQPVGAVDDRIVREAV